MHPCAGLHVRVARELPANAPKLRRRIPLELTADELDLLEREQKRFGSKRATLVAGLEGLTRALGLEQDLEQALHERDQAQLNAEAEAKKAEKKERALARSKEEASAAKRGRSQAERKQAKRTGETETQLEALRADLEAEQAERRALERELAELEGELLLAIHCPRCRQWASSEEWATRDEGEFQLLYHEPCGFHRDEGLRARSVIGYRRR